MAAPLVAQETPSDTTRPQVRAAEPIPFDTLDFAVAAPDTTPVLAPRFRVGQGAEVLASVPSEDRLPLNPRNAAIRSFLVPGWGQWYTGHPLRGAFFAAAEVGFAALGYHQQRQALARKRDLQAAREAFFADPPEDLPEDPVEAEDVFERTAEAVAIRSELQTIKGHREDFYAYAALSAIFGAVDAYVAAQLDPLHVHAGRNGRVSAELRLPLGPR